MTYEQALAYLATLNESRIKPGLERINEALFALGSPHLKFPHILVGGTNGKGSVVAFMGTALSGARYRTGLFTSPHLIRFEERIVIDGKAVNREELVALVTAVRDVGIDLTYFEFAAVMALLHFAKQSVDIAILEVGIGGSWDATNATEPVLSVITSVDLDHQYWLGSTLEEVAHEKSGIMRTGKPVVIGPLGAAATEVVLKQARDVGAAALLYGRDFISKKDILRGRLHFEGMRWNIKNLTPGLKGAFQLDNAACALAALEGLSSTGIRLREIDAVQGIESVRWPGRFQKIGGDPPIIVDAAHNVAAVRALIASLEKREQLVWLFSALADKDIQGMAKEMARVGSQFVLVPLNHPRAATVKELVRHIPEDAHIMQASSVPRGVEEARMLAAEKGCVVVAGSVVLAGEVLEILSTQYPVPGTRKSGARSD